MLYGLYQSAQGAHVQAARLEVAAHNIANSNTTAFKQDVAVVRTVPQFQDLLGQAFLNDFDERGLDNHNGATAIADVVTDFSNGPIRETGGPLDLALRGPGFFRVSDGSDTFLTRNGSFALSPNGSVVTADSGLQLLDITGKPVVVAPDSVDLQVNSGGLLSDQAGPLSTIGVSVPPDTSELEKLGDSLYREPEGTVDLDPQLVNLIQGYLEQSGVEPMSEMMSMVEISRAFEMNMTMIQYQDQSLGRLLGAVGRV